MLKLFCVFFVLVNISQAKNKNIILLLTDEERVTPPYDLSNVKSKEFHAGLKGWQYFRENGMFFDNFNIGSAACVPSRGIFMTGHYPQVTGITTTTMINSTVYNDLLKYYTFPTIGNVFAANGYNTKYIGKWQLSNFGDFEHLSTVDLGGKINWQNVEKFLKADLLEPFGFSRWIGPDYHSFAPEDRGLNADGGLTDLAINWLNLYNDDKPFLLVLSLINPHDIVFVLNSMFDEYRPSVKSLNLSSTPTIPLPPSRYDQKNLPNILQKYIEKQKEIVLHFEALNPLWNCFMKKDASLQRIMQYYYYYLKEVDQHIARFIKVFKESHFRDNTIIIRTSDHGSMLGAHGMHEKWESAFQEVMRVPLAVAGAIPKEQKGKVASNVLSQADILPTLAKLANIDIKATYAHLYKEGFVEANRPLPGRDFSPLIEGKTLEERPVYFYTDDDISGGSRKSAAVLLRVPKKMQMFFANIKPLVGPRTIEAVIARHNNKNYKIIRYFDLKGDYEEEWQVFNLSDDPEERIDLKSNILLFDALNRILQKERARVSFTRSRI